MLFRSNYIIEKLHLNKDITAASGDYCIFCQIRFDNKKNYIVPDICDVIAQDDSSITIKYLTNYYNHEGKRRKFIVHGSNKRTDIYNGIMIREHSIKHYIVIPKKKALEILEDILKTNDNFIKYNWSDIIYTKEYLEKHSYENDAEYSYLCYDEYHKLSMPNSNNLSPMTKKQINELIEYLK